MNLLKMKYANFTFALILLALFINGCVSVNKRLELAHDPLNQITNKKAGNILVKQFVHKGKIPFIFPDPLESGMAIGEKAQEYANKRKESMEKKEKLIRKYFEALFTSYFAEALKIAGYNVIQEPLSEEAKNAISQFKEKKAHYMIKDGKSSISSYYMVLPDFQSTDIPPQVKYDVIIEGEILNFHLDLSNEWTLMLHHSKLETYIKAIDPINQKVLWKKYIGGEVKNPAHVSDTVFYERAIRQAVTKALNEAVKEFASDEFYKAIKKKK